MESLAILPKTTVKHDGGKQRLEDEPGGAEDGLLELGHEVATDEEHDQVPVAPEIAEMQVEPCPLGLDDEVPGFGRTGHGFVWVGHVNDQALRDGGLGFSGRALWQVRQLRSGATYTHALGRTGGTGCPLRTGNTVGLDGVAQAAEELGGLREGRAVAQVLQSDKLADDLATVTDLQVGRPGCRGAGRRVCGVSPF